VAQTTQGFCGEHYVGLKSTVHPTDDLRKVASLMFNHDTTWLPCIDDDGVLVGHVNQRGITHYLGATYRKDAVATATVIPVRKASV
jgi:osmoprotectant transport system ATP-binding protein